MRIAIEYQYTDRNYSRFVTYAGITHEKRNGVLAATFILKRHKKQPLQQNLSSEQAQILANAGDNTALMTASSAFNDSYLIIKFYIKN
jgi:hypothetical protein